MPKLNRAGPLRQPATAQKSSGAGQPSKSKPPAGAAPAQDDAKWSSARRDAEKRSARAPGADQAAAKPREAAEGAQAGGSATAWEGIKSFFAGPRHKPGRGRSGGH